MHVEYGYALMLMGPIGRFAGAVPDNMKIYRGHGGEDFGSTGMAYYIPGLNAGFSFFTNRDVLTTMDQQEFYGSVCEIESILYKHLAPSLPRLMCTHDVIAKHVEMMETALP